MLLLLPPGTPPIYYHDINFIVELISIIALFVVGPVLFVKKRDEIVSARRVKMGYGFFTMFYALCRIFFIVAVWYPDEPWSPNSYDFFVVIGYFFASLGFTLLILVIERYLIQRTKHVFSIIGFSMAILYFLAILGILDQDFALLLSYVSSPVLTAVIVFLYLYLAIKGTAELRRKAIVIIVAIALIGISSIIDGETLIINAATMFGSNTLLLDVYYSIPPLILMVGFAVFVKGTY
jgi:hypothetical protein